VSSADIQIRFGLRLPTMYNLHHMDLAFKSICEEHIAFECDWHSTYNECDLSPVFVSRFCNTRRRFLTFQSAAKTIWGGPHVSGCQPCGVSTKIFGPICTRFIYLFLRAEWKFLTQCLDTVFLFIFEGRVEISDSMFGHVLFIYF
jgi:hypothetical protein